MTTKNQTILNKLLQEHGGSAGLGARLGISKQAVGKWNQVPVDRVLYIEEVTGVSRHDLRPDIYPLDDKYKASEDEDAA